MKEMEKNLRLDTEKCSVGEPAKGYRIVEIRTEPSEVLVRGPKYILQNRQFIPCAPIDISGATKSFSRAGKIPEAIDNMPVSTNDSFRIFVTVAEELVETTLKTNINILYPPDFAYQVKAKPQEIELKLKGPAESLKALKQTDFTVFVNMANLYSNPKDVKPGSYPGVAVEFLLSEKAPRGIILPEPLSPVMIEISELPKPTPPPSPEH
jgi:YbbR domain-containing protein